MLNCELCSNTVTVPERCEYCSKMACRTCQKSSKRVGKVKHLVICKGCWGDMDKRKKFKSA